ncbi:helix-turn-helix domain-containing protein [Alteromonas sp. ASW11-19]|uniref:Helix-turn-helix domain-containing protein n=1 Tax=Alteromonas salexigens TaxID=2982530 RepID=A0ABT2VL78_9ALTE|nr:helix-turn-helix domain-containing protein [Alteromonas salexigens]MCU7554014.1 helix-turn-helix domain-containing protein [Alteromonas salexigens]
MNSPSRPFSVTLLGFDAALSSTITGAMDLFALAGVSWQRIHQQPVTPFFSVQLATLHGHPVTTVNQLKLHAHCALQDVEHTDLLVVPTIGGDLNEILTATRPLHAHIHRLWQGGADIAANCTGTFLLAETGILNHKVATTHWGYARQFRERYPEVNLQPAKMVTQQDNVYCAGGGMAWFDLTLLLIERYCGHQVASDTAKSHVLDLSRPRQTIYAGSRQHKFHQDTDILNIQNYMEQHFTEALTLTGLAHQHNMTPRTLIRRFKQACGITPLHYLQALRLEQARKYLEVSTMSLDTIVTAVGYEDVSSFSRLFKRHTGLAPSQYRSQYAKR